MLLDVFFSGSGLLETSLKRIERFCFPVYKALVLLETKGLNDENVKLENRLKSLEKLILKVVW
ncbi:hypothetical protein HMPREF2909_06015 [Alloscardovia sp. HMSC034E08]|nr:hypothetical protein HMPREF2909_06015 [Alloscardovia sp. HMSC034E08]